MIHGSAQKMSNLKEPYENKLIKQIILVQHNLESNDNYILKHWQVLVKIEKIKAFLIQCREFRGLEKERKVLKRNEISIELITRDELVLYSSLEDLIRKEDLVILVSTLCSYHKCHRLLYGLIKIGNRQKENLELVCQLISMNHNLGSQRSIQSYKFTKS